MDLDQETAKELEKSVIDGFEEESIMRSLLPCFCAGNVCRT